jgi:ribosomal protein S18 acetylase RimI-like enzyme
MLRRSKLPFLSELRTLLRAFCERYCFRRLEIFGSTAAAPESNVDMSVILTDSKSLIRIRKAEASDLPALLDTLTRCVAWMKSRGIEQWDERYPTPEKFAQDIERGNLILSDAHGVVAATVVLDTRPDPEYAGVAWKHGEENASIVHRLMVRPEFQGQGLARRMIEHVEEKARRLGYTSIRLDAYTENHVALRLYEKLGYSPVGTIRLRKGVFRCYEKGLLRDEPGTSP